MKNEKKSDSKIKWSCYKRRRQYELFRHHEYSVQLELIRKEVIIAERADKHHEALRRYLHYAHHKQA